MAVVGFSVYRTVYAAYPYSVTHTPSTGETILSDHLTVSNSEHINNNIPESIDDYSANDTEMQSTKDPYSGDSIQLAITLDDELQGLRYQFKELGGLTYWYENMPTFMRNNANYDHGSYTFDISGLLTVNAVVGTSTVDFGSSTTSLEIPNDAAVTVDKIGEIGLDTTVTGWHQGFVTYFGTEANYLASFPTDTLTTANGNILEYNAERDQFEMASATVLGTEDADISDPAAATAITFGSIPANVKTITIQLVAVSTDGTEEIMVQLGDSDGAETSGYTSAVSDTTGALTSTTGFVLITAGTAALGYTGTVVLTLEDAAAFTWMCSSNIAETTSGPCFVQAGAKSLSAELDRVVITSTGTPDDFDAGSINIQYGF